MGKKKEKNLSLFILSSTDSKGLLLYRSIYVIMFTLHELSVCPSVNKDDPSPLLPSIQSKCI